MKVKVRKIYVLKLVQYLLHHNPAYVKYVLSEDAVNVLPDNGFLKSDIVYYDVDDDANESVGSWFDSLASSSTP